ncbi:MAG: hypothetical protein ACPGJS_01845 [Flammeovirgaceae bacterium]
MQSATIIAYQQLKQAVAQKLVAAYPNFPQNLSEWKGQAIATFQEELAKTVNGRVSEKWFYTHLKPETVQKLPRTDMLDLLSKFVGYDSWQAFLISYEQTQQKSTWNINRKQLFIVLILAVGISLLGLAYSLLMAQEVKQYKACIVDAYLQKPINTQGLQVFWLKVGESPVLIATPQDACFELETKAEEIQLVIQAPYFKSDTIIRKIWSSSNTAEQLLLMPDDYALMIHYFSNAKVEDWKKRRAQLQAMFTDEAKIFQVDAQNVGMELYNKEEFINKLIIPLNSLRNIRVLQTVYHHNGKIQLMRFIQED